MFKTRYLIRLDDACPYMDKVKWGRMEDILDRYKIKPLVGIIPANIDPATMLEAEDKDFWSKARGWEEKGWTIALHGFNHVCESSTGGVNPVHKRSEFAGIPYENQAKKIIEGYSLLKDKGFDVEWFFAPSHTFDKNTLKVIKENTPIRYICDMIATKPYVENGLIFVPCQMGKLREMPISGYWCACYHPNVLKDEEFIALEEFLKNHCDDFLSFNELPTARKKSIKDKLLSFVYYTLRLIKR